MRSTPTLGPTDADAYRQAYEHGYSGFDHTDPDHLLPDDVTFEEIQETDAMRLSDFEEVRVAIVESHENKSLWWSLDDFYAEHKSDEIEERYQREAAVAEDFDTAFQAGAYAALRGEECDPQGDLPFLLDSDET